VRLSFSLTIFFALKTERVVQYHHATPYPMESHAEDEMM